MGGGFEPPKSLTTDLQSVPFGRSGTPPHNSYVLLPGTEGKSLVLCRAAVWQNGAGDGNRTYNLLITNQLLCRLSYASTRVDVFTQKLRAWQAKFCNFQNFFLHPGDIWALLAAMRRLRATYTRAILNRSSPARSFFVKNSQKCFLASMCRTASPCARPCSRRTQPPFFKSLLASQGLRCPQRGQIPARICAPLPPLPDHPSQCRVGWQEPCRGRHREEGRSSCLP